MHYTIYILAGGKSSRMGADKGLIKIKGEEMVLHCINKLKHLKQEIVLISSNVAYKKFGLRLIADELEHQGPAQGILTALEDSQTDKCLIVSCDMPLMNDLIILQLNSLVEDFNIACYKKEFLYPFPGIYSKSILNKWKEKVKSGERALQKLIPQFNHRTLPIEHPDLFLNVNTPEDIQAITLLL